MLALAVAAKSKSYSPTRNGAAGEHPCRPYFICVISRYMAYDPSEFDWNSDPEPETAPAPASAAPQMHIPASVLPDVEGEPDELDEVERRLEKATYYKMLLKHQLINSDSDEAIDVENEIQDFVRERLAILLGIKSEPTKGLDLGAVGIMLKQSQPFSDDEVTALKAVAAKVLGKPTIVQASTPPKPAPTIKPLEEPKPQPVKPAPAPVVEAPKPVTPPPAPVKRGRGRPRKNPAPAAAPAPAPVQKSEPAPTNPVENDNAEIRVVGGKRYKVVKRVINDPATGKPKVDAKGNPLTGEQLIDVTPKAEIPGRQAFPSIEVMNAMESAKAAEVLSANPIAAGLIPTAMTMTPKED